ncbi:MAG TPA: tryptophan--tRNA ligase [Polyangiaceae bacterium]|nr:tryptophan--tRNA ligase [Polyangiaceae bacterium]
MPAPKRLFSGMQPTGGLHVGNWLGALRNWAKMLDSGEYECLFCVVDAHAITVEYDTKQLGPRSFDVALTYMACGLDPERSTIFLQSDVPQHAELAWYLGSVTPMGELSRMTQFKEKSEEHKHNLNAGLFTYPILMAADVLLYKAEVIPVGDDQVQHLELAREICRRFNARYGETFPEPQPKLSTTPRIMGLDGKAKMSKTRGNAIDLFDEPRVIEKKLKGAFTDPQKLRLGDPGRPEICNVFTMHTALQPPEPLADIDRGCRSGALSCGECKLRLRDAMLAELAPVRERGLALKADPKRVLTVLQNGAEHARSLANQTLVEVRHAMGLTSGEIRV